MMLKSSSSLIKILLYVVLLESNNLLILADQGQSAKVAISSLEFDLLSKSLESKDNSGLTSERTAIRISTPFETIEPFSKCPPQT